MNAQDVLVAYFFDNRTEAGLILDRASDRNMVSMAATGFGMDCWAIAAEQGRIGSTEASSMICKAIDSALAHADNGWLYHFTDASGVPKPFSEVSTIDTAIFYLGARQAARRLGDTTLLGHVTKLIAQIDDRAMMTEDGYFVHGRKNGEMLKYRWDEWNEGVLIYRLFGEPFKPIRMNYDLPLFVFYYPMCFLKAEYFVAHLRSAVAYQKETYGLWGLTATDGPTGYEVGNTRLVSPLAMWSVSRFIPEAEEELSKYPVPRHTCSYHVDTGWKSMDKLGIDYGSCLILLNNSPK